MSWDASGWLDSFNAEAEGSASALNPDAVEWRERR
jgi:hypothetical protein